ncbi:MAG: carbon-nitrogen hydrolase family protein [Gammaproteobacteria bacterium]|nr:carbon-nitrogen hydrolase family protein [Gammaproteobacteria bacterium]
MTIVAAIQMASGPNVQANLDQAERLITEAVAQSAKMIVLPEYFSFMGKTDQERMICAETDGDGLVQRFLSEQSKKHGVWLVGGTIPVKSADASKLYASCMLFNDAGERVACYHKIHLFDVHLDESDESYHESQTTVPGDETVVVDTPFGRLGLAICYDLRFPELFRTMVNQGMEICAIPSSFTALTGKAHWEVLVRARAIENLCYVVAAGQGGYHVSGRETYGNSMIVSPWGTVLNHIGKGAGVVVAKVDKSYMERTREHFPALTHRRLACKITTD